MAILYRISLLSLSVSHKGTGDASSSSADSFPVPDPLSMRFPFRVHLPIRCPFRIPLSGVQEILLDGAKSRSQCAVIRVILMEADFHIFRIHAVKMCSGMSD